jgi:hypothetical protein
MTNNKLADENKKNDARKGKIASSEDKFEKFVVMIINNFSLQMEKERNIYRYTY